MQTILYHNSSGAEAFAGRLKHKEVHRAITLHPVKQHRHLYRVHNYMRYVVKTQKGRTPSLHKFHPRHERDLLPWEFFSHALYSATNANPRRRVEAPLREALDDIVREVMEMTNAFSRQRGRVLDFKEVLYGYHRLNPLAGQDVVLDVQLVYRKYRGRKMTIPVRRHSYLQRAFLPAEIRETRDGIPVHPSEESRERRDIFDPGHILGPAGALAARTAVPPAPNPSRDKLITFLVPLSGRLAAFKRFAALYEEVCLDGGQSVALVLVLFPSDEVSATVEVVRAMQRRHPHASLAVLPVFVPFARGLALQLGAAHVQAHSDDTILFFVDVDVVFTAPALQRVRLNTIRGRQAYFPIVFSEFDPSVVYSNDTLTAPNHFLISDDTGYWRNYGFGIASAYPADLAVAGGFDTAIRGWGKEDVDLYDKFIRSNVSVFRAADPGLVHVFHVVECDSALDPPQLVMCHGTRANTYAGAAQLARILDHDPTVLRRARERRGGS
ncbi:hypothetical protein B566_EDAN010069 [Ephemera danica]|nr:hypothetical protein B566_EDAN010069 [Ephemera danica]